MNADFLEGKIILQMLPKLNWVKRKLHLENILGWHLLVMDDGGYVLCFNGYDRLATTFPMSSTYQNLPYL